MFENIRVPDNPAQLENIASQTLKFATSNVSNLATIKFINQLQSGTIFNAIFEKNLPGGKGVLSLAGNEVVVELPKQVALKRPNEQGDLSSMSLKKGQTMSVRVENLGSKPALKIIPVLPAENSLENELVKANLTARGKSISRFLGFDDTSRQSTPSTSTTGGRVFGDLNSSKSRNSFSAIPLENTGKTRSDSIVGARLGKMERSQFSPLSDVSTDNKKVANIDSLKPYLPARMPLAKMAQLLKTGVLDSSIITDLKIGSDLMSRLRETLNLLLPDEGEMPNATKIRKQIDSSGINYEAKVRRALESPENKLARHELARDLKGLLLELKQATDQGTLKAIQKISGPLAEFRQTIKLAIDNIELNQLSTQISKQENQTLVIQIPNPLSNKNRTIQLFVRDDNSENNPKNKDPKRSHNVAFILDLSFLGKIKINAKIGQEHLSVGIDVEDEDVAGFINKQAKNFELKMKQVDFDTSVECHVTKKVESPKDHLIELLVSKNTSLVNIKT